MTLINKRVQCQATTKKGNSCSRNTIKYPGLCYQHFQSKHGLKMGKSGIPGAGTGLFATRPFKNNDAVAKYTGKTTKTPPKNIEYSVSVPSKRYPGRTITARTTQDAIGSRVNDCRTQSRLAKHCRKNNAKLAVNTKGRGSITVRATKRIRAGDEVFAAYGAAYWSARDD